MIKLIIFPCKGGDSVLSAGAFEAISKEDQERTDFTNNMHLNCRENGEIQCFTPMFYLRYWPTKQKNNNKSGTITLIRGCRNISVKT